MAIASLRVVGLCFWQHRGKDQQDQYGQQRERGEQQIGGAVPDAVYGEARGGRADQGRHPDEDAEDAVVAGTRGALGERADHVLHGDRVENVAQPDQRGGHEQAGDLRHEVRQREARWQSDRAEQHRYPRSEPVGEPARVHRQEHREQRIHREQHADHQRIRAELERVQGKQHLAALEGGVDQERHQQYEQEGHPVIPGLSGWWSAPCYRAERKTVYSTLSVAPLVRARRRKFIPQERLNADQECRRRQSRRHGPGHRQAHQGKRHERPYRARRPQRAHQGPCARSRHRPTAARWTSSSRPASW